MAGTPADGGPRRAADGRTPRQATDRRAPLWRYATGGYTCLRHSTGERGDTEEAPSGRQGRCMVYVVSTLIEMLFHSHTVPGSYTHNYYYSAFTVQ